MKILYYQTQQTLQTYLSITSEYLWTNLLVNDFKISMETTGGDASWLNVKNERHNRSIHNMIRAARLDSNQYENKWCWASQIS